MDEQDKRIENLAKRWREGEISDNERIEFDNWFNSFDDSLVHMESDEGYENMKARLYENVLNKSGIQSKRVNSFLNWRRKIVAASLIFILATASWLFFQNQRSALKVAANHKQVILPGSNQATLMLANGKKILLTNVRNGVVAKQGIVSINKTANGQLTYSGNDNNLLPSAENVLQIPRGGQYHLTLSDGTQVWLNAASSIRFPISFTGSRRQVQITGEAYFEVAKDKAHPFVVIARGQSVEVLGTHFNINSYDDEPAVRTTLLEGSVKIIKAANGQTGILKPGEQSTLTNSGIVVKEADTEEAVAWKNGYFMFNDENIGSIMRKLSRWYNVDIFYNGPAPADKFEGTVDRFTSIQQVLKKLELTDRVHFKIEERRVIVSQ